MGGEEGAVLQPGDHCGWGASGDTGQSAGLLRVGQVGDGGPNWRDRGKEGTGGKGGEREDERDKGGRELLLYTVLAATIYSVSCYYIQC